MSEFLNRFSFQASKLNAQIIACIVVIWLAVLWCAIASILAQPFTRTQRIFWVCVVVLLPLVGLLAYLPFSFRREDLPPIFAIKPKDRAKRSARRSGGTGEGSNA